MSDTIQGVVGERPDDAEPGVLVGGFLPDIWDAQGILAAVQSGDISTGRARELLEHWLRGELRNEMFPSPITPALPDDVTPVEYVRDLRAAHDRRVTELLEANNREVERRRAAEAKVAQTREALAMLLSDTQHANHECNDDECPVAFARSVYEAGL